MLRRGLILPRLLLLVIGLRIGCVCVHPLHCVDQGLASHIVANVFWHIGVFGWKIGGSVQEAAVKLLDDKLKM